MTRIPMKDYPPSLKHIVEKFGDPSDALARIYFDYLDEAGERQASGNAKEADEAQALAEKCRKELAEYGFIPGMVDGVAKALRPVPS